MLILKIDQHLHLFSPGDLLTARYYLRPWNPELPAGNARHWRQRAGVQHLNPDAREYRIGVLHLGAEVEYGGRTARRL